jgi:hypothetical protein
MRIQGKRSQLKHIMEPFPQRVPQHPGAIEDQIKSGQQPAPFPRTIENDYHDS